MSTATQPIHRAVSFWDAPIGKKAVMAVTGVILFGFVVGHLIGNLQVFSGPEKINAYAAFLHNPGLSKALWAVRLTLLAAVVLHIVASIQLWNMKREARPTAYVKKADTGATYAGRTMMWSGPIVGFFIVYHIMHLTLGVAPGAPAFQEIGPHQPDVYANLVHGFRNPLISGFYIVAMILLCLHLYHGAWSMFQSLGVNHPRYTPYLRRFAAVAAILICIGNISIPLAILAGVVR